MGQTLGRENQFVVDILTTLRQEHFSPPGWWRFLRRSWEMSRRTAHDNPGLKRSWALVTVFVGILAVAMLLANFFFEGPGRTFYILPGFVFCVAWQQSDLFWHLGLNRSVQSGTLLPTIGMANTLTWLRGLGMLLRFCLPLVAATASYFLFAQPVRFGSTIWGKYAGLAQCLYFLVLLAPPQFAHVAQVVNLPLLLVTLILLFVAPLAQFIENVRERK